MKIGLRIDVDTFRGATHGVPKLCRLLSRFSIQASFFFSVGPDNMGRHLWRLLHPGFLRKMLRTNAAGLYGWDILFKGTLWPGPVIGRKAEAVIRSVQSDGHEVGLHAWDHHGWQAHIATMSREAIYRALNQGFSMLDSILGHPPGCAAVPAWRCNNRVLEEKEKFPFAYNSDCRGESIFYPVVEKKKLTQPQIPVTLPTYDEVVGKKGISNKNYNNYILSLLRPEKLNVLTIHAEAEGIVCLAMFKEFLRKGQARGVSFVSLKEILHETPHICESTIIAREIPGREGWVSCQASNNST